MWQPVEASEDEHGSFLSGNLIALDCSFLKVDLGLKAGLFLKVLMNLGYEIGSYIRCYAIRIYIRIRSTWFQKNIKSEAQLQSSMKRVHQSTTYRYKSRMNRSCKGLLVCMSHYVASDWVLLV